MYLPTLGKLMATVPPKHEVEKGAPGPELELAREVRVAQHSFKEAWVWRQLTKPFVCRFEVCVRLLHLQVCDTVPSLSLCIPSECLR